MKSTSAICLTLALILVTHQAANACVGEGGKDISALFRYSYKYTG